MKIIHTSDLHIGSPLNSRLAPSRAQTRRKELLTTLEIIIERARKVSAEAIIIAGDLFDSERATKSAKSRTYSAIERASDISFIYTAGNHEGDTLSYDELPKNLIVLSGDGWSYHSLGDVCFAAKRALGAGMFDDYEPRGKINIAVLHGELRSYTDGAISPKEAAGRSLDYIALGHYHTYSATKIDDRCTAVYSGAPHGRGFDELGELGYVVIDTDTVPVSHSFAPLGMRRILVREVDVTGLARNLDIESRIQESCADVREIDLLKVVLIGERTLDFSPDTDAIYDRFANNYFHFEVVNETKVKIDIESIRYDKTLKGEFIRLVMADPTLTENDKTKIIDFGIRALMRETPDE